MIDGTVRQPLDDVASLKDTDNLIGFVELGQREAKSVNVVSDTEAWILHGHPRWGFRSRHIKTTEEAGEQHIKIKRSSLFEHKFAVVAQDSERNQWSARRYQLEQDEDATLKIQTDADGLQVSVLYGENNHEVALKTSGEPVFFDQQEAESRQRKIATALAVAQVLLGIVAIPLAVALA